MRDPRSAPVLASCFNRIYLPQVATAVRSFADSGTGEVRWHMLTDGSVQPGDVATLTSFARDCGVEVVHTQVPEHLVKGFEACEYLPPVAWYRSRMCDVAPDEPRVLYLDCDVLVVQDLTTLWSVELDDDHLFAAVTDPSYSRSDADLERLGLPPGAPHFNSGVMLMDLERMRECHFGEQVLRFATSPDRPVIKYGDQCAMNALFPDRWKAVHPRWNTMNAILLPYMWNGSHGNDTHHDRLTLMSAALSPAVVHFEGPPALKPWNVRSLNPFTEMYRALQETTPWPMGELQRRGRDVVLGRMPPKLVARVRNAKNRVRG